jgi:hypothetical protein
MNGFFKNSRDSEKACGQLNYSPGKVPNKKIAVALKNQPTALSLNVKNKYRIGKIQPSG